MVQTLQKMSQTDLPATDHTETACTYPLPGGERLLFLHATREYYAEDAWIYFSRLKPHRHADLHLVIPLSGRNQYQHQGRTLPWGAHQGVLMNSWEPHEVRPQEPGTLEYAQITFHLQNQAGETVPTTWSDLSERLGGQAILRDQIPLKTWQAVTPDLLAAVDALQRRDALGVMGRFMSLLSRLAQTPEQIIPPELQWLEQRISQAPQHEWNTTQLAALCGWSSGYLHRRCKVIYGCTPMDLVYRTRLLKARSLLLEGHLHLEAIAQLCGFADAYHFSRRFKKWVGISPGTWRKQYTQNSPPS